MDLSKPQADKIMAFIRSKWSPAFSCPCCGNKNWTAAPKIFQIMEYVPGGGLVLGGSTSVFPIVALNCTNCGFSLFINALTAGAFEENKTEKTTPSSESPATPVPTTEKLDNKRVG